METQCLTHYLEGRINDGNVLKVPCPDPNCPNEIHDLDVSSIAVSTWPMRLPLTQELLVFAVCTTGSKVIEPYAV